MGGGGGGGSSLPTVSSAVGTPNLAGQGYFPNKEYMPTSAEPLSPLDAYMKALPEFQQANRYINSFKIAADNTQAPAAAPVTKGAWEQGRWDKNGNWVNTPVFNSQNPKPI